MHKIIPESRIQIKTVQQRQRVQQCNSKSNNYHDYLGRVVLTCQTFPADPFPFPKVLPRITLPETMTMTNKCVDSGGNYHHQQQTGNLSGGRKNSDNKEDKDKRRKSDLVDQLLLEIYWKNSKRTDSTCTSESSFITQNSCGLTESHLEEKDREELFLLLDDLQQQLLQVGNLLVRRLKRRDALCRQRDLHLEVITNILQKYAHEKSNLRFSIDPAHGESGFSQWKTAMKMVVQLPEGIPDEFRRKLWINLSEKYLSSRNVNWDKVEGECFSEWANPADTELDVQIVKDLHRTGCSLFCGENGQEKQAVLKKVLLAYARWNKHVGYCQGFNMLAALILQVTEGCESDALKIMIFLIEGVLPESYFADSLRGLSVDMVVFRELLKTRLPQLSNHLEKLQHTTNDGSISYEPPLTNVFTMQWFLTIFCNCLPHTTVLRVWDLIFLEGNDVLLRAALCIWQLLEERIMTVRNADEFYCIMGVLTREMLELDLVDANALVELIMEMGPLKELRNLREKYLYNINPWAPSSNSNFGEVDRQLKLYQKENLKLDISALKKQYLKLKHRQRQAHIIFTAAINKQPPPSTPPIAINHLLLGKSAILPSKRIGPPKGSIPPPRQPLPISEKEINISETLLWRDAERRKLSTSSSSSSDTELCDNSDDNEDLEVVVSEVKKPEEKLDDSNNVYEPEISNNLLVDLGEDHYVPSSSNLPTVEEPIVDKVKKVLKNETTEYSDDSELEELYFEQFLQKRVGTLKSADVTPLVEENTQETTRIDPKESRQRAFEIIQENSLILHRILQCQQQSLPSQVNSPQKEKSDINIDIYTPEKSDLTKEEDTVSTTFHQKDFHSDYKYKYDEEGQPPTALKDFSKTISPCSPVGSKDLESQLYDIDLSYQDDNRTNTPPKLPEFDFTFKEEDSSPSKIYSEDLKSKKDLSKNELDDDYSRALEKKYEELVLKPRRPSFLDIASYEKDNNEEDTDRYKTKSNEKTEEIANGQTVNLMEKRYYPPKKSPSKSPMSDPFPVRILSRQNKDVCIRLGLYKKS